MNQPTEDRFRRLEEEQRQLKEEVRKLKEQQTEPIKITRLEIDQGGMHKRLDAVQEDTNILKIEMQGARADILRVSESQADQRDRLIEHGQRLESIEQKQDTHTEILDKLVDFAESHEKNMATKEDVQAIRGDIGRLESIMMKMLDRMPKIEGE